MQMQGCDKILSSVAEFARYKGLVTRHFQPFPVMSFLALNEVSSQTPEQSSKAVQVRVLVRYLRDEEDS
jgi:hypothetical protein